MAAHDNEFVYVDIAGNEVDKDDPAVQTRYTRRDFKALDKAVVFGAAKAAQPARVSAPAAGGGEDEAVRAFSQEAATGAPDLIDPKGAATATAVADDDDADATPAAAAVKHAKK